jgi:hypothetical protein
MLASCLLTAISPDINRDFYPVQQLTGNKLVLSHSTQRSIRLHITAGLRSVQSNNIPIRIIKYLKVKFITVTFATEQTGNRFFAV